MSETSSLSIFTIEAHRKPQTPRGRRLLPGREGATKLRSARSGGIPLCDENSILRVRLELRKRERVNRSDEAAIVHRNRVAAFLVDVGEPQDRVAQ